MTTEDLDRLSDHAKKAVEAKGYRFYRAVYEQGIRDAEKFYGITEPTYTTRERRRKDD